MITSAIISRFNLQVDDASELSSAEELALANEVYTEIADDRPWEWLKATATGNTSTSLPYIALPADFKELSPNRGTKSVIFIGIDFQEYQVVPFSNRRDYRNMGGVCYIDVPNQRLYFTLQPTSVLAVEYDYIKVPTELVLDASPLFKAGFHQVISYGMAAKFSNIEQLDKSRGITNYQAENRAEYRNILTNMAKEDSEIKLAI